MQKLGSPAALVKGEDAAYVKALVDANLGLVDQFAKVTKVVIKLAAVNKLQVVQGSANADLSAVGVADKLTIQVVGLIAHDKLYLLTMVTRTDVAATMRRALPRSARPSVQNSQIKKL